MSTATTTFAVVAEDQYRRERATREIHALGGGRHHRRFAGWRDRRTAGRVAGK